MQAELAAQFDVTALLGDKYGEWETREWCSFKGRSISSEMKDHFDTRRLVVFRAVR